MLTYRFCFKPPSSCIFISSRAEKNSASDNKPINLDTCCHMRQWIEIKKMEVNHGRKPWYNLVVCFVGRWRCYRTEAEMIINTDLDSTLNMSFFFLSMEPWGTQKKLSLHRLWRTTFHLSPQYQKCLARKKKGHPIPNCLLSHFFPFGSRQCWVY